LVQNATSEELRELAPDGTLGGAYQRDDADMRVVWDAGVVEVRELLTDGWLDR
jgi:creatinine amidohydrolase